MLAIAIVLIVVLGGGTSLAAENSAPGDLLYGVKTSVNENVRATLAIGAEADAKWEAELAERRLDEAEKLSAKGTSDASLFAQFESHARIAQLGAEVLRDQGHEEVALEIESEINATLSAHGSLIAKAGGISADLTHAMNAAAQVRAAMDAEASSDARVGDMDGDGKPDTDQSDTGATMETESGVDVNTGGASVKSSTTINIGL